MCFHASVLVTGTNDGDSQLQNHIVKVQRHKNTQNIRSLGNTVFEKITQVLHWDKTVGRGR